MRIATYNLRNLFGVGTHPVFNDPIIYTEELVRERCEHIASELKKADADIIIVNEIGSPEVLEQLAWEYLVRYRSFMGRPEVRGIGNGVMYRGKVSDCVGVSITLHAPTFILGDGDPYAGKLFSKRELVYLTTSYQGKPLHVFGVHLKSALPMRQLDRAGNEQLPQNQAEAGDGHIRTTLRRLAEARALRAILDNILVQDSNAQIVVAGDFNDTEFSATLAIVQGREESLPGRLENVCLRVPDAERFSKLSNGHKKLIDHILVSESLVPQVGEVRIFNQDLLQLAQTEDEPLAIESDHALVVVELVE